MMLDDIFSIIKYAIWGNEPVTVDQHVFDEMRQHAIASLLSPYLLDVNMSEELKQQWTYYSLQLLSYYTKYSYEQAHLPITVPYVILKGTTAAQYYPYPKYRAMGDIDILTRREDFDLACQQLMNAGYRIKQEHNREICLVKNQVVIELHRSFASLNNIKYAEYMDNLIYENINPTHVLPDLINGLVLLEHISQHLENGLGLRQIIDWMMFVDKCLPDDKWDKFEVLADNIGLKELAIITTYMCEMYLGLPHREWCTNADESLSQQLMDYVLSCGNFGQKRQSDEAISENVIAHVSSIKRAFILLQKQGLINWQAAKKYRVLRPFAWIYQANRYVFRGLRREKAASKLKEEYKAAKKRNAMFDKLGIKTASKGIVLYKDGRYVK